MPQYTDADGRQWNIEDWPGNSYKATVINNAYANSQFCVENLRGRQVIFFECFWCKRLITSAGVQGDHVAAQRMEASSSSEVRRLFRDAQAFENDDGTPWNLVLSCSECNGGTRNRHARTSRSHYDSDRERQEPGGSGLFA